MVSFDPLAFLNGLSPETIALLEGGITLLAIAIVYKLISRYLNRVGAQLELDEHSLNSIRLILRVLTILVGTSILFTVYQLPTDLFVGGSALVGAIVGFGSSQTINNIAAGFYVILSRPFRVKDYVKIGDVEGQVEEISINYTKLYTPSFNLLLLPNTQVMSSRVVNCTHEGFIKYTFSMNITHSELSNDEIEALCIRPAIDDFVKRHGGMQLRRPEYLFEGNQPMLRSFKVRIFIPKGEAKLLYTYQPELYDMVVDRWDHLRAERAAKRT
ncbi:TPA: mechanosensitive ion channel [Candidatus Bathyarchaeota archaeon]|nr:mechanosensitive ion channel [Candidatus Bathyarchaeota archaeon]